ncbi:coagulation factor XIII A chain-like [Neoarius graeffei]|uniref:coagulation factor XIII A chain-like n=1 Tax=Neoarius graeffei TaxID=443677 RepID=UPI00298BF38F|nr:coagulation factor XIII A chain-like [Neoarius graeffei]
MSLSVCVGTAEERRVLEKAEEFGCQREKASVPPADVEVEILALEVQWGEDFDLELQFTNRSSQQRVVNIYISGNVVYYTGVPSAEVIFETPVVELGPQQSKKEKIVVRSKDYQSKLVEQGNLNFITTGKVKETGRIITTMRVVYVHNPKLTVQVAGSLRVAEEIYVTVEFTNPFKFSLENVYVRTEGPGIVPINTKQYSLIAPGSSIIWSECFSPRRAGTTKLIASLDCAALRQVYGEVEVTIQP